MPDAQPDDRHAFDQTNGVLPAEAERESIAPMSERDRRRGLSIAQGLGYISTGHN